MDHVVISPPTDTSPSPCTASPNRWLNAQQVTWGGSSAQPRDTGLFLLIWWLSKNSEGDFCGKFLSAELPKTNCLNMCPFGSVLCSTSIQCTVALRDIGILNTLTWRATMWWCHWPWWPAFSVVPDQDLPSPWNSITPQTDWDYNLSFSAN